MTRILIFLLAAGMVHAQGPEFEVASVKINRSGGTSRLPYLRGGTMTAQNVPLKWLIESAYGVSRKLIYGPSWLDDDRFDVNAKAPNGVPDTEFKPLLQALLKTRFRLALHREMREMDTFDMVVAKGGLKLAVLDPEHPPKPAPNMGGSAFIGTGTLTDLARDLILAAGKPVVDRTGIEGRYFWDLRYTPLSSQVAESPSAPPDIFRAMQEQLGLKLDARKQPIEVLVVDAAERVPTEN